MALEFLVDEPWAASNPNRVKLLGPACVEYGHPDLDNAHKFLIDFGLVEAGRTSVPTKAIFYRGYGVQPVAYVARQTPKPEFRGAYFEAASNEDLIRATMIPGAGDVEELDHPGGGKVVHIVDPAGLSFSIIFGMKKRDFSLPPDHHKSHNIPSADYTDSTSKPRRGSKLGLKPGMVPIHKVGHIGYAVTDLEVSARFYSTHFNFKPSEITAFGPPGHTKPGFVFFHVDLGQEYSDHHCLMLSCIPVGPQATGSDHSAFEVQSVDATLIGHEYLTEQGYRLYWGVGRHFQGSIVYDYWYDVEGFLLEHYADSDLVNENTPVDWWPTRTTFSAWGPHPPREAVSPPGGGIQARSDAISVLG